MCLPSKKYGGSVQDISASKYAWLQLIIPFLEYDERCQAYFILKRDLPSVSLSYT